MRFDAPRTILHGSGVRFEVAGLVGDLGKRRPLIVTDRYLVDAGVLQPVLDSLKAAGLHTEVFLDVQPDPTEANVELGLAAAQRHEADLILAFGGGSPIDCAKAVRYRFGEVPLVAIPTTAGTGSEATPVMVITDTVAGVKRMTRDVRLIPDLAIVDYELSATMPRALTAHVGVDTLTHGMEAFVSRRRHELSNLMARSSMERCVQFLRRAWVNGADREARAGMALAALEGGLAFGNSSVALVHGMSRPLGALFHIPHGLSNAVLLPEVTRFSYPGAPDRYGEIAMIAGIDPDEESLIDWLTGLNRDLEVPRLRDCCGNDLERFRSVLPKMAKDAIASGSPANNPVVPSAEQIEEIYLAAW